MGKETQDNTVVEQVEMNLDDLLGIPGADNVMLPEKEKKASIFTAKSVNMNFLSEETKEEEAGDDTPAATDSAVELTEVLKEVEELHADDTPSSTEQIKGRPKIDKSGTTELIKKLIDSGKLIPFDDEKPIDEYSIKDFEELIDANFQERERKLKEETPKEFFEALPEEMQVAAQYLANGGTDLKTLFRALSQVEETRELDVEVLSDQERIVREYLSATRFGTNEEIQEEIDSWKDRDELKSKASKFKPKLDAMQQQIVQQKLIEQENLKKQQQAQAQKYISSVYDTLSPGEINGIKLERKTQELLYTGLIQPNYPSISGRKTNMLGHLLEKYQYVEPNHGLIAEALWLLADPEGYRAKMREQGEKTATEKAVRLLKTEEARKNTSSPVVEKEEIRQRSIPRTSNIFKR